MVRMQAPKGVTQVSVELQNFKADKDGFVTVPDNFVPKLRDIGFRVGPFSIEVSAKMAEALKNTSAQIPKPEAPAQQRNSPKTD